MAQFGGFKNAFLPGPFPRGHASHISSIALRLLVLALFTGCASQLDRFEPKHLLTVSFQKSKNTDSGWQSPFSSRFEAIDFEWYPAAAGSDNKYLYTRQQTCLHGNAVAPRGDVVPPPGQVGDPAHKIFLCFSINDPAAYTITPPPIHTGHFPIAKIIHVPLDAPQPQYLDEVNGVGIVLEEAYSPSNPLRERNVQLDYEAGQGWIDVTVSEKDRLAGKIEVHDTNLSITGSFDCPSRSARVRQKKIEARQPKQ